MRRAGCIFVSLATAISLVLFVASVGLWIRSYYSRDIILREGQWASGRVLMTGEQSGSLLKGAVYLAANREEFKFANNKVHFGTHPWSWTVGASPPLSWTPPGSKFDALGFHVGWARVQTPSTGAGSTLHTLHDRSFLITPFWFLTALSALLPAWWLTRRPGARRAYRARVATLTGAILCPTCGYDLRETRVRCPECGAGVDEKPH